MVKGYKGIERNRGNIDVLFVISLVEEEEKSGCRVVTGWVRQKPTKNNFNPQTPQPPPSPQHNSYPGLLLPQVNTTITLNECKMINTATQTTGSTGSMTGQAITTGSTTDSMNGQAITTGSPGQATTTQSPTVEGEKWTSKGRGYAPTSVTCWCHCL